MKITSMDVHRKEFGHAVRGYREDEVDDFLDAVAVELDRLNAQIAEMDNRLKQSESQSLNFEAERNTINNALLTAQRASDEVLEQAKVKGKKLLDDANARAEKILLAAQKEKQTLLQDIDHLKSAEEKFRADIYTHAKEIMDRVEEVKKPLLSISESQPVVKAANLTSIEDLLESEEESVPTQLPLESLGLPATPVQTKPTTPPPPAPAAPPPIKKEEGMAQWGEMEDDLETID